MLNLAGYFLRDTQNVTGKDWNNLIKELMALRNYQFLHFKVNQGGTAEPDITDWYTNDLEKQGDTINMSYVDFGRYTLNSEVGLFKPGKTFIEFSGFEQQFGLIGAGFSDITANTIAIQSVDTTGALSNDMLIGVEFKVYILD